MASYGLSKTATLTMPHHQHQNQQLAAFVRRDVLLVVRGLQHEEGV